MVCFADGTCVNAEESSPWEDETVERTLDGACGGWYWFGNKYVAGICTSGFRFNDSWLSSNEDSRIIGRKYRSEGVVDGRRSIQKKIRDFTKQNIS